ncbi:hypothetical protein DWG18_12165 [Lysobacter sp. TY2-98]|uniref:DUF7010 family protein n=1 Tax=Lysobacter sp. TY2-98 TaxID=2290922 RepID=UPI000E20713A|nr:hypothetical protein [Lysobacter sp. TY2-98]AXK72958.1 hypothetical protein DWG18_12165 [Lysobacter sp. TY2-98]
MTFDLQQAQADMRRAYYGGATGMAASSIAWFASAIVAMRGPADTAVWTLLVAGVFIFPASVLLSKLAGRSGAHAKGNPLGMLAGASTFWLVFSLPLAYAASRLHIEWFFPAMLLVIGGRYLTFDTLYGERLYWACGLALAAAGFALGRVLMTPAVAALAGGAIEAAFALVIALREQRAARPVAA